MTALVLALALVFSSPAPQTEAPATHAIQADSADVWRVSVDGEDVMHLRDGSAAAPAELPYSRLNFRTTLTVHYVTEEQYPRARTLEFVDQDGLVMFAYEEMEESEDNPMSIPLDALALALGGRPEGPLSVTYRESSGGTITREDTVLFVISPD